MKKDRRELENYLLHECEKIAFNSIICEKIADMLYEKYNIATGTTMDMITREKLAEQTEHILFCLLEGITSFTHNEKDIEIFFTPIEIETLKNARVEVIQMGFPMLIPCFQVADGHWITSTDTKFFMELRAAQMINYNENTQRALTKFITKDGEHYKITLKKKTVSAIRKCLQKKEYISTPITLNIPVDETDFYYDDENHVLIINSLKYFDIADGYHRYVAMCQEHDANQDFNYPWELRIVNFPEDKARSFVYQESQKTEMSKVDANAMNSYALANRVATTLNQDSSFELFGEIKDITSNISLPDFIKVVDYFYCKDKNEENQNQVRRSISTEIRDKFNYLISKNDIFAVMQYSYVEILVIIYVFSRVNDLTLLNKYIDGILGNIEKINKTYLQPKKSITKPLVNKLDQLFEEVK